MRSRVADMASSRPGQGTPLRAAQSRAAQRSATQRRLFRPGADRSFPRVAALILQTVTFPPKSCSSLPPVCSLPASFGQRSRCARGAGFARLPCICEQFEEI